MKEFIEQINHAKLSDRHIKEGSVQPTQECKALAIEAINYLYAKYGLIPSYASATVEDGIYVKYTKLDKVLQLEIYNDLEIAGLVADEAEGLIGSFNVYDFDFTELIDCFLN